MTIFRKLKIFHRFLGAVCCFSLPLGVLFYFNVDQLSEKVSFAEHEIEGVHQQRPLVQLLVSVGEFQVASLRHDPGAEAKRQEVLRYIDAAEKAGVKDAGLTKLKSRFDGGAAAVGQDDLTGEVQSVIAHVGDTSNLTLDPELDSYYLADVTSVVTAQTLKRIAAVQLEAAAGPATLAESRSWLSLQLHFASRITKGPRAIWTRRFPRTGRRHGEPVRRSSVTVPRPSRITSGRRRRS